LSIKANWKVVVENTLEAYHVGFVHENNFKKVLSDESEFEFQTPHSWWRSQLRENVTRAMAPIGRMLKSRKYQPAGYVHLLVFPNITIATTLGLTFSIQHFIPLGVGETEFVSYLFSTTVGDEDQDKLSIIQAVNESAVKFNREIFEEDRVVVEQVQCGIAHAERPGLLSDEELRVYEFQKAYIERFCFEQS
jgi:phenylpropionate dioxygenase-like ring-hydroxylating dioxygenase large terminal subunit